MALSGRYTRLASLITANDKEYFAKIRFGKETDTLDPDGTLTGEAPFPDRDSLDRAIALHAGTIEQRPPQYSAVHIAGKRASDRVRDGEVLEMPPRQVTIYSIDTLSITGTDTVQELTVRVRCSSGTYIRSLARDIARHCGSCAYLTALRRTAIGPFRLDDAAGASLLGDFSMSVPALYGKGDKPPQAHADDILKSLRVFTKEISRSIGLPFVDLNPLCEQGFFSGQKMHQSWFNVSVFSGQTAVFLRDMYVGIVEWTGKKPSYVCVAGNAP